MKKALLFLPTILLGLISWNLPKVNTPAAKVGKIIKAAEFPAVNPYTYVHGDSTIQVEVNFEKKGGVRISTVVIDPGHGGHDPGCSGANSREKHLALAIGNYLATGLRNNFPDVKVVMTRSTDVFIPLHERAAIATREKADLFISIHCNYIPKANHIHGTETYVLGLHATEANLEVAKRENASILLEENYRETYGYDPNSPEAHILFSMFQNAFLEQSILFAQKVQQHAAIQAERKDRGVKQAGFLVLRHATMPSVLVETGYLSNRSEEDYLRTTKGQKEMANALLEAFAEYKLEMEGGTLPVPLARLDVEKEEPLAKAEEKTEPATPPAPEIKPQALPVKTETAAPAAIKEEVTAVKTEDAPKNQAKTNISPKPAGKIIPSTPVSEEPVLKTPPKPAQSTDIQYCVQLAASPSLLDISSGKWTKVDYLIEVLEEGNLFKYQVRNFATQNEADGVKQKLRALGFNDAFVVAYQNGQRVHYKK